MQSLREKMATSIEGYIFSWDIFEEGYYILWYYSQLDPNIETSTLYFRLNISYALLGHLTWFNKIENKIIYRSWKQKEKRIELVYVKASNVWLKKITTKHHLFLTYQSIILNGQILDLKGFFFKLFASQYVIVLSEKLHRNQRAIHF